MKTNIKTFTIAITLLCTFAHLHIRTFAQVVNGTGAGNCLSYDGVNDYVNFGTNPSLNPTEKFSFSAWVKATIVNNDGFLFGKESCTNPSRQSLGIYITTAGKIKVQLDGSGMNDWYLWGNTAVNNGNWNHIAVTWDKNGGTNNIKLYVNGALDAQATTPVGSLAYIPSWQTESGKPSESGCALGPYLGLMDEVTFWNITLSQAEIQTNMCKKLNGNESGLIGYWRFDEGSGSTAYDASGNGNNGTLY